MSKKKLLEILKKKPENYIVFVTKEDATPAFNLKFIKQNPWGLRYIDPKKRTKKLCLEAIKIDPDTFEYYPNEKKTYSLCLKMISINGSFIRLVPEKFRTAQLVKKALTNNGLAIAYLSPQEQTEEFKKIAILQNPDSISHISQPTTELKKMALSKNGRNLRYIKLYFYEKFLINVALNQTGKALEFVENQSHIQCIRALKNDPQAYEFVKIVSNPNYEQTLKNLKSDFFKNREIYRNKKIVKATISCIS